MSAIHQGLDSSSLSESECSNSEDSKVQGLFEEAAPFIRQVNSASELETSAAIENSNRALERLSELSDAIADYTSTSVQEIALKVALYRAIAPEASLHHESSTVDERLLVSIIGDIENIS